MMRALPLLLFLIFLPVAGCVRPLPPQLVTGVICAHERWHGTIQIAGDVVITAGASVTLEPGSVVEFLPPSGNDLYTEHPHFPGSELIVRGTLTAVGTAAAPITFRYVDPQAPAGSWGAINLQQDATAVFRYCSFRQADSAIHSQESTVAISESLFTENRVAIRFHTSSIRIEHNLLQDNEVAIRFHFGAPIIRANIIRNNGKGFFVSAHPQDYQIEGNTIVANREASVVLGEEVPEDLVLASNYWGGLDTERIEGGFFDGRRSDYLGRVRFLPLLSASAPGAGPSWSR